SSTIRHHLDHGAAIVYATHFNKETGKDVWIIGGSQLYKEVIEKDILDEMYITTVKMEIDNSSCVYFPKEIIKWDKWKSTIIKETDLCTYTHWIKT
ncbi:dihydrofolate reductase, partial [Klebsiella pneumoniae]|uniref:dihydrofolate reductase n=1 Tax=Klebsiella pneumoniae TaxID=573 RepID=UPI0039696DE6